MELKTINVKQLSIMVRKNRMWLKKKWFGNKGERFKDGERGTLKFIDFTGIDFAGEDLRMWVFICCDFSNTDMKKINISHSYFDNCIFNHTNLRNTKAVGVTMKNCSFRYANLINVDARDSDMSGSDFYKAHMGSKPKDMTNLTHANITGARFDNDIKFLVKKTVVRWRKIRKEEAGKEFLFDEQPIDEQEREPVIPMTCSSLSINKVTSRKTGQEKISISKIKLKKKVDTKEKDAIL